MSPYTLHQISLVLIVVFIFSSASAQNNTIKDKHPAGTGPAEQLRLPAPFATPSARNTSKVIGWPKGKMPTAAPGLEVTLFAENLNNPRQAYVLPNQDILVVEAVREGPDRPAKSGNQITLFRDTNNDGKPDVREAFLTGLTMPHGMLLVGNWFYIGNTNGVVRYAYRAGQTKIEAKGDKILDLPVGGHYTRNLIADPTGGKIYIAIGSASNVDEENQWEKDPRRAGIVEINLDGSGARIYANGLRNPVGMDWEPKTKTLWTVVNERDLLGDDLVPDYLTSVKDGGFYGWPIPISARTKIHAKKASGPIWSPKRSNRTMRSARTRHHSAWLSTRARPCRNAIKAARSSACTARGTGPRWSATKSPSCRSRTATRPDRSRTSLRDLSPTKVNSKPTAARLASPLRRMALCSSPTTAAAKSGASGRKNSKVIKTILKYLGVWLIRSSPRLRIP